MYELTPYRLAILDTINWAEGSPGYDELFNYVKFNNLGPHPNQVVTAGGYESTAAGAYQFLYGSWQDTISAAGLPDFMDSATQDQAALKRIEMRGALGDIDSGNIEAALPKLALEWASFPGSPYGQPTKDLEEFIAYFNGRVNYYGGSADEIFDFIGIDSRQVPTNWALIAVVMLSSALLFIFMYLKFQPRYE